MIPLSQRPGVRARAPALQRSTRQTLKRGVIVNEVVEADARVLAHQRLLGAWFWTLAALILASPASGSGNAYEQP